VIGHGQYLSDLMYALNMDPRGGPTGEIERAILARAKHLAERVYGRTVGHTVATSTGAVTTFTREKPALPLHLEGAVADLQAAVAALGSHDDLPADVVAVLAIAARLAAAAT
jgi:hypothetical protein